MRIATASVRTGFAMTCFLQGVSARLGGGVGAPRPTECNRKCSGRDDVGIVPYGCIQGVRGKWRIYRGLPGEGQREGNF